MYGACRKDNRRQTYFKYLERAVRVLVGNRNECLIEEKTTQITKSRLFQNSKERMRENTASCGSWKTMEGNVTNLDIVEDPVGE